MKPRFFLFPLFILFLSCKTEEQKKKELSFEMRETFEGSHGKPLASKELLERMENLLGTDSTAKYLISHKQYSIPADRFSEELKNTITRRSYRDLSYDQYLLWARNIAPKDFFEHIDKIPLDDLADFAHQNPDDSMLTMSILPFLSTRPFENYHIQPEFIKSTPLEARGKIISAISKRNLFLYATRFGSTDSLVKDFVIQNLNCYELISIAFKNEWVSKKEIFSKITNWSFSELFDDGVYLTITEDRREGLEELHDKWYTLMVEKVETAAEYQKAKDFFSCPRHLKKKWVKKLESKKASIKA